MVLKHIVNGVEIQKVSPVQIEKIEEGCRQLRSEFIFESITSLPGLLASFVQKLLGLSRSYQVN